MSQDFFQITIKEKSFLAKKNYKKTITIKPPQAASSDNRDWPIWSDGILTSFTVTDKSRKNSQLI